MSQKWKAASVGLVCSLIAVGAWILFSVVLNFLAGLAGALMGILFLLPYKKLNLEDKSNFPYIAGGIVIVAEVFLAELISVAILAAGNGLSLATVFASPEIISLIMRDVLVGIVLSAVVFGGYIFDTKRKEKTALKAPHPAAIEDSFAFVEPQISEPEATDISKEYSTPTGSPEDESQKSK